MPTSKPQNYKVFISHSARDEAWVSEFASELRTQGVHPWLASSEIAPGERWKDRFEEALRQSSILVVILSSHNVGSPWTFFELGAAVADKKRIIPILLDDVDQKRIPILLNQFQWLKGASPNDAGKKVAAVVENSDEDHGANEGD